MIEDILANKATVDPVVLERWIGFDCWFYWQG
jgi:hypothetical protein